MARICNQQCECYIRMCMCPRGMRSLDAAAEDYCGGE